MAHSNSTHICPYRGLLLGAVMAVVALGCHDAGQEDDTRASGASQTGTHIQMVFRQQVDAASLDHMTLTVRGQAHESALLAPSPMTIGTAGKLPSPVTMSAPVGRARHFRLEGFAQGKTLPQWRGCTLADVPDTGTTVMLPVFGIEAGNQPPQLQLPGEQASLPGFAVRLPILASDPDCGDLRYDARNLPPGLTIDRATGLISGTITSTTPAASTYTVEVTVSDGSDQVQGAFPWRIMAWRLLDDFSQPLSSSQRWSESREGTGSIEAGPRTLTLNAPPSMCPMPERGCNSATVHSRTSFTRGAVRFVGLSVGPDANRRLWLVGLHDGAASCQATYMHIRRDQDEQKVGSRFEELLFNVTVANRAAPPSEECPSEIREMSIKYELFGLLPSGRIEEVIFLWSEYTVDVVVQLQREDQPLQSFHVELAVPLPPLFIEVGTYTNTSLTIDDVFIAE